ncbi:zinc finger protein 79-like [Amblyraja radiata]|uniref:zinc finger protein 79-like n=1 Tax=Amblyraja radiata TaxID=386614 RepID=UPI001403E590|nr:zinc finger protein 79-like [Amblyraja radiata]
MHSGERPLTSSDCGKSFKRTTQLKIRRQVHTVEKSCGCSTCGKSFTQLTGRRQHRRVHSSERPFTCYNCLHVVAGLKMHRCLHTSERPCTCSDCGKSFTCSSRLLEHQRTNTGERPCAQCGMGFTTPPGCCPTIIHINSGCSLCFKNARGLREDQRYTDHDGEGDGDIAAIDGNQGAS